MTDEERKGSSCLCGVQEKRGSQRVVRAVRLRLTFYFEHWGSGVLVESWSVRRAGVGLLVGVTAAASRWALAMKTCIVRSEVNRF